MDLCTPVTLPCDLAPAIFSWAPPLDFLKVCTATCKSFSFQWYVEGAFSRSVVVPDEVPSLNAAINRLANDPGCFGRGLVIVRPGTYAESVRVTQNCYILGVGHAGEVVVEAPGWESALVSAGLGGRKVPNMLGWKGFASGEDARVENLTFRCRNQSMRGRCVYIVMGQLQLVRCVIEGGVMVSGYCTAPQFYECRIQKSRGCGMHLTDQCGALLARNDIGGHGSHGVLVDRQSRPQIVSNYIHDNLASGIRIFEGREIDEASCADVALGSAAPQHRCRRISENIIVANGAEEVSLTPRFVAAEE